MFKREDLIIGWKKLEIGASVGTDFGVTLFLFGEVKTVKN